MSDTNENEGGSEEVMSAVSDEVEEPRNESPIPLKVAWAINIIGWIVFVATMNHAIEVATGVVCLFTAYCGHKGNDARLRNSSLFESAWMFAWAAGLFSM